MKILLVIYNYKAGFPFIQDIEKNLKDVPDMQVDILDTDGLFIKNHENSIEKLPGTHLFDRLFKLPRIGFALKVLVLKSFLRKQRGTYEAINIHNCDPIYIYLAKDFRKLSPNVYPMIWGSDFYRANRSMRQKKRVIFDNARYIIFANPVNARDFIDYYQSYQEKSIVAGFGVSKFDKITKVLSIEDPSSLKKKIGLPQDRISVAIGYNGTKGQQHLLLIKELAELPPEVKEKIFVVLQMTYGYNKTYSEEVKKAMDGLGMPYKLFTEFLDDEQTSQLRASIDVVLNAQITDGFSSSLQEHIYAGNIVVVGDWLPYQPLELAGITYLKSSLGGFGSVLEHIISDYDNYKSKVSYNSEKIYAISSWKSRIKNWVAILRGEGAQFLYKENEMQIK